MDPFRRRSSDPPVFDTYTVRIMLGLVSSLSLLLLLVHLPLRSSADRVGWSFQSSVQRIVLSDVQSEKPSEDEASSGRKEAPPPTELRVAPPEQQAQTASATSSGSESPQSDSGWASKYDDVQPVSTLGTSDQEPRIVGGKGSLYLHINYPEEARRKGIEGRLELEFTIEPDGSATGIEVVDSLHPLCDSAAVKAVRSVEFIPAKHQGIPIPIRMKLPVRFQLTAVSSTDPSNGRKP